MFFGLVFDEGWPSDYVDCAGYGMAEMLRMGTMSIYGKTGREMFPLSVSMFVCSLFV